MENTLDGLHSNGVAQETTWRRRAGWTLTILPALAMAMSAALKLSHASAFADQWVNKFGFPEWELSWVGLLELACVTLYLIPRTDVRETWAGPHGPGKDTRVSGKTRMVPEKTRVFLGKTRFDISSDSFAPAAEKKDLRRRISGAWSEISLRGGKQNTQRSRENENVRRKFLYVHPRCEFFADSVAASTTSAVPTLAGGSFLRMTQVFAGAFY
jgi:hypothetical protein